MTHSPRYFAGAACIAAVLAIAVATPVAAKDPAPGASTAKKTEVSKRHKRHSAKSPMPASRAGWSGSDPTRGGASEYMRQMQRDGRCFVDEGYGRYSACSNE